MKARHNIETARPTVVAVALALVSLWVLVSAVLTAVWLTDEVRVAVLVTVPAAIVASLLILYFDWRGELERRALAERDVHREWRSHLKGPAGGPVDGANRDVERMSSRRRSVLQERNR